ncbi:hypothetical protein KY289_031176 [Solanum tuberosum]|nr:hypothetical protein KY289_031176 [Solanum tuberosum]
MRKYERKGMQKKRRYWKMIENTTTTTHCTIEAEHSSNATKNQEEASKVGTYIEKYQGDAKEILDAKRAGNEIIPVGNINDHQDNDLVQQNPQQQLDGVIRDDRSDCVVALAMYNYGKLLNEGTRTGNEQIEATGHAQAEKVGGENNASSPNQQRNFLQQINVGNRGVTSDGDDPDLVVQVSENFEQHSNLTIVASTCIMDVQNELPGDAICVSKSGNEQVHSTGDG